MPVGDFQKAQGEKLKAAWESALKVLTAEQRAQWQKMIGKPFAAAATLRSPGPCCHPGGPGPGKGKGKR
jgi:hypothetical protein